MRSDGAAHGKHPTMTVTRLAALEVPCVPPGPLGCKPPHRVPSALKGRSNLMDSHSANEARALFHNSRTIVPACERRDGDGQQLVEGGLLVTATL